MQLQNELIVISVVIPVYNCSSCLNELTERIINVCGQIGCQYEIIYVNDASQDNAWDVILSLSENDKQVKGLNFSRNFGQHYALSAGLAHAVGNWIVTMDCDLQDQPEDIIPLYQAAQNGFDIVYARRINRKESWMRKLVTNVFYRMLNFLIGTRVDPSIGTFRIFSHVVNESFNAFTERVRYFGGLMYWLGFRTTTIDIEHTERKLGKSSYSFQKMVSLGLNAITSFSDKPIRISIGIGIMLTIFSLIFLIRIIINRFLYDVPLGYTSIIVSIFFIGGLLFMNMGLLGLYIGKIFNEVKNRPMYVIKNKVNL